jgi:hypothetical protein
MLPNNQKFYRPYETYENAQKKPPRYTPYKSESDSEPEIEASDDESGSVTTTTSSKEHLPNFVEFATNLELNEAGGQSFPTTAANLQFGINELNKNVPYSPYKQAFNISLPFNSPNYDLSYAYTWKDESRPKQPVTSIVMLNSRDRDRNVYPTPSALTLRLPRVYQNITSLQVVQMKLLSSFLYFRADKNNISMTINEFGRIFYNYLGVAQGVLNITKRIREGTYNINSLIAELNTQLNTPPIFFDYPGGFNQFVPLFVSTGDFSIAFNYPGDYFYDSLNRVYTAAPTRTFITTRYWATTTLGFTPNLKQTKVAYYYPVLREYVLDPDYGINKLNTNINTSALLPDETIYSRIVYAFQGVNDIIIQQMIDANVTTLDIYRSAHTFRQDLINRYVVAYETFNNRIYIQTPSLSTSLVNLLNTQYAIFLAQQLALYNLTAQQYTLLQTLNSQLLSVVNAMYDYIQTQMAIYFGINFNTFAPVYFTQANNYVNIQNALNAIGISSNYDTAVITNDNDPFTTNIIEFNRQDPVKNAVGQVLWPRMSNLPYDPTLGMLGYATNLGASNTAPFLGGSNYPYEITVNDFDFTTPFIDADGDVTIDIRRKAGDIICPINASRYTVFRFRSLYRQTLQVETMPRPTQYRYPLYNPTAYNAALTTVFDNSYSFVFNSSNSKMDNVPFSSLSNIYGFSNPNVSITTNFGISYTTSQSLWGTNTIPLDVRQTVFPFVFYLPLPPSPPAGPAYTHTVALSVVNYPSTANLPAELKLFLYHDRAAFMADLSGNVRNESPLRYKQVITTNTTDTSGTLVWTAYAGQTYYAILRSANTSFQSLQAQLVLYYPNGNTFTTLTNSLVGFDPFGDPYSNLTNFNYAQVNDPNFIRLPVASNLWGINPTGNEVNKGLVISNVPIGYDTNDVSTDLTDYVGFVPSQTSSNILPNAIVRCDPTSGYFFQVGSPYNTSAQSYFYSGSSNFILTPINQSNYTPSNVPYRQYKIVQWYDPVYIPDPANVLDPIVPATDLTPNISPYNLAKTSNVPISNYDYDVTSSNIQLGLGCCGFSFVPSDGLWSLDKVMFRSAFINNDKNNDIAYLGVFITNQLNATPSYEIDINNAVAKLDFSSKLVFSNAGDVNFGFDGMLGTYYEFTKDSGFTQEVISGFDQNAFAFTNSANNFYSVIPFDSNGNVTYMRYITGGLTPYPYVCDASAGRFYFDGKAAPNRRGIVLPGNAPASNSPYGPPTGISYTLSQYEQSIPIGTQILHYLSVTDIVEDLSGFQPWSGVSYIPSQMYADVSGVMMIQSTDFKFYSYPYNNTNRTFTYLFSLTVDDIYPVAEATSLVAAAGNTTSYAFLGFQVVGGQYQVRIKVYDVGAGTLVDIGVPATFVIPDLAFSVNTFSYTNNSGFVISGTTGGGVAKTYRTPNLATPFFEDTYPVGYTTVKSVQPPAGTKIYFLPITATGSSLNVYYAVNESSSSASRETYTITAGAQTPTTYSSFAVTNVAGIGDQILFLTQENLSPALTNSTARFYKVKQITGTSPNFTAKIDYSDLFFTTPPPAETPYAPLNIVGGALGSKWAFFNQPYYIWGNRNDNADAPVLVQNAWQMFYPTIKVVLRKLANAVNPITDLSGLKYPEFPHSEMFVYNTVAAYSNQINSSTNPRWGFESSGGLLPTNAYNLNSNGFLVSDVNFSGYYFNSYIFNVPLLPNSNTSEPYYYLALRSYTPSEKSQVLLRFNMPQRYDFGFVRLRDLSNEPIFATASASNAAQFNPSYYNALLAYNSNFIFSNVNFGYNPSQNIPGSNITSAGFGDFLRQYTTYFNTYTSNVQIINTITSNVNANMLSYINTFLTYILPDYAKTRQNYTESITFSILWRSALTPLYLRAEDDWGLGFNLGYAKRDTNYASIHRAESFFKILDDYIYLRLNPEYDMNRMDFGGKENLRETNEPTGSILGYNAKLLLNTFGNYAQTIIQNPVYFNPPLLKLDKLSFVWFDTAGTAITNAECEWNAAIQIVESMPTVNVLGKNPVIVPPEYKKAFETFRDTGRDVRFFAE